MVSYSDKTISGRIKELSGEYTVRKIDVKRYSSNQHLAVEMGVFGFFHFLFCSFIVRDQPISFVLKSLFQNYFVKKL